MAHLFCESFALLSGVSDQPRVADSANPRSAFVAKSHESAEKVGRVQHFPKTVSGLIRGVRCLKSNTVILLA